METAQQPELSIPVGYREFPHQVELHDGFDAHRNSCVLAHRRCGKTVSAVAQVIRDVYRCPLPMAVGVYIAPTSVMARKVAWPYFTLMLGTVPGVKFRRPELTIEIDVEGDRKAIYLMSAENPDRLRGMYLDVAVVDEMADCPSSLITSILRPALADRKGKLICIGTVKGRNEFWRLYERAQRSDDWFAANLLPDTTNMIAPDELELMRREMSDDEFRRELLNDPDAAVKGAFYGKAFEELVEDGRLTDVAYDERLPVIAAMDLGISDSTAVWFAQLHRGGEVRLIDYAEWQNTGFLTILRECADRWPVERWIGPHDLDVREFTTAQSRLETAAEAGFRFEVCPRIPVIDGIEAVRLALRRCVFDQTRCAHGVDALRLYRSEWDDKRNVLSRQPVHDWTSHAADAFRYLVVGTDGGKHSRGFDFDTPLDYSIADGRGDRSNW